VDGAEMLQRVGEDAGPEAPVASDVQASQENDERHEGV
jgi:hypothetical protein